MARAYLSVIEWPAGFTEQLCIDALVEAAGFDRFTAGQVVRRGFPQVVKLMDQIDAQGAADRLHAIGAMAISPSKESMDTFPAPVLAKRFWRASPTNYLCLPWRGDAVPVKTNEIVLLVRARLKDSTTTIRAEPGTTGFHLGTRTNVFGASVARAARGDGATISRTTRVSTTEMLDLYLTGQRSIRINADKFGFGPPDAKPGGISDRENLDALTEQITGDARGAILDLGFGDFRCPPDVLRSHSRSSRSQTMRSRSDDGAFDFYSVWARFMYEAMLSG